MPILKCECKINDPGFGDNWIEFCPLHEAAPDLLEACKQVKADMKTLNLHNKSYLMKGYRMIKQAIAKATKD